jgi:hypothetical protein
LEHLRGIGTIEITPDTIDLAELALQSFKNWCGKKEERSTDIKYGKQL